MRCSVSERVTILRWSSSKRNKVTTNEGIGRRSRSYSFPFLFLVVFDYEMIPVHIFMSITLMLIRRASTKRTERERGISYLIETVVSFRKALDGSSMTNRLATGRYRRDEGQRENDHE